MDMYLTFEGIKGHSPIVLTILAWSHGLSNRDYSSGSPQPQTPHPRTWDQKALHSWLKEHDLESLIEIFDKEGITGKELLNLSREDLKELGVTKVSTRVRLEAALGASNFMSVQHEDPQLQIQDISMTAWMDDRLMKLVYFMSQETSIPLVTFVCYHSGRPPRRYGGGGNNDDNKGIDLPKPKKGDPCMSIQLKNAKLSSLSFGGSGGEDHFTANLTLSSSDFSFAHQQFPSQSVKYYADYFPEPHGIELTFGSKSKPGMREWGKIKEWNVQTHFTFPSEFRTIVHTMLLVHSRAETENHVSHLPKTALMLVFEKLSDYYIPTSPLAALNFPGPEGEAKDDDDF